MSKRRLRLPKSIWPKTKVKPVEEQETQETAEHTPADAAPIKSPHQSFQSASKYSPSELAKLVEHHAAMQHAMGLSKAQMLGGLGQQYIRQPDHTKAVRIEQRICVGGAVGGALRAYELHQTPALRDALINQIQHLVAQKVHKIVEEAVSQDLMRLPETGELAGEIGLLEFSENPAALGCQFQYTVDLSELLSLPLSAQAAPPPTDTKLKTAVVELKSQLEASGRLSDERFAEQIGELLDAVG